MRTTLCEIESIRAGQPRPYADSVYEAYISCRVEGELAHGAVLYLELAAEKVQALARLFVRAFPEVPPHAFAPRLVICEPVGPTDQMCAMAPSPWAPGPKSRWHVLIVQPFTD